MSQNIRLQKDLNLLFLVEIGIKIKLMMQDRNFIHK